MPTGAWYFLIAAVLVVVVFAIWKGRGLNLRKGREGFEISVKERAEVAPPQAGISVGEGLVIKGSTTGAIAGVMAQGGSAASVPIGAKIDVLKQGQISDSTTGDITGVRQADDSGAKQ